MESIQADVKLNERRGAGAAHHRRAGGTQGRRARPVSPPSAPTRRSRRRSASSPPGTSPPRPAYWRGTTPEGPRDATRDPHAVEIDASVAATIYSLWRGQALELIVDDPLAADGLGRLPAGQRPRDDALRRLLEGQRHREPRESSSWDAVDRDTKILQALESALVLAAYSPFTQPWRGSYQPQLPLGQLQIASPARGPFSIPPEPAHRCPGPEWRRDGRRLQRRRRLLAQPAGLDPQRLHVRQRPGAAVRIRGAGLTRTRFR